MDFGAGRGLDMKKELRLMQEWEPLHTSHVLVETPRAFADINGILVAWVLPSIVPPSMQVGFSEWLQTNLLNEYW